MNKREEWFRRGHEAFIATFPELAAQVPWAPFYVCPICWHVFRLEALAAGEVTVDHIPPESAGGGELALTCKPCNNVGGSKADSHMRREADVFDFFARGTARELKGALRISSDVCLPGRVSASRSEIQFVGNLKQLHLAPTQGSRRI